MINEEKVKQLYKVALHEQEAEKYRRKIGRYYREDYIAKEILKSIFTGTMAYLFMSALWLAGDWINVFEKINNKEYAEICVPMAALYVVYMIIYMTVTYVVYKAKYKESSSYIKNYEKELVHLNRMYEQEE